MARTKVIAGVGSVPMTTEEEAQRDIDELAWANRPLPPPDPITPEELYTILFDKGIISDTDRPRPRT